MGGIVQLDSVLLRTTHLRVFDFAMKNTQTVRIDRLTDAKKCLPKSDELEASSDFLLRSDQHPQWSTDTPSRHADDTMRLSLAIYSGEQLMAPLGLTLNK